MNNKHKILINASNLYVGGGVQVAISFIEELVLLNVPFIAAISPVVKKQLSATALLKCQLIDKSPSGIVNFKARNELTKLVKYNDITTVFTIFGPSYWSPPKYVKHTVGFALPWLIYDLSRISTKLPFVQRLKKRLLHSLQIFFYKKNANVIITETEDVSLKVSELLDFDRENVLTVPNTLNGVFYNAKLHCDTIFNRLPVKEKDDFWLLTISHDYPHKNLNVIKKILPLLPDNYKFITTLDEDFLDGTSEEHKRRIITLGPIAINECPPLYNICDALFLPTLLECFSASYLEAMYSGLVILTSNLSFAHTVCHDAAFYFDPYDINDISKVIIQSFSNNALRNERVEKGKTIFDEYPDAKQRALKYIEIITS